MMEIQNYMNENLAAPLQVENLCLHFGISKAKLHHCFKEVFVSTPHQFLIQLKINHAQHLLLNHEISLELIAEKTGFSNTNHFSKVFKKQMGITPHAFREKFYKQN